MVGRPWSSVRPKTADGGHHLWLRHLRAGSPGTGSTRPDEVEDGDHRGLTQLIGLWPTAGSTVGTVHRRGVTHLVVEPVKATQGCNIRTLANGIMNPHALRHASTQGATGQAGWLDHGGGLAGSAILSPPLVVGRTMSCSRTDVAAAGVQAECLTH